MEYQGLLDFLPLWTLLVATVGISLLSVEIGHRIGDYRRQRADPEKEAPVSAMVGATLALLGFMLAFTFGLAATRFDDRRLVVVEEANAIGTAYLRAELISEPQSSEARKLLRDYVDVRLEGTQVSKLEAAITKSNELHNRLWAHAVTIAKREPDSIVMELFVESLNTVIDLHSKRIMIAVRNRIPSSIWMALYIVAILGMGQIGYHAGLTCNRRSLATVALICTFSTVMYLIADLDRSHEGLLQVSQQAMLDLRNSFIPPSTGAPEKQP